MKKNNELEVKWTLSEWLIIVLCLIMVVQIFRYKDIFINAVTNFIL